MLNLQIETIEKIPLNINVQRISYANIKLFGNDNRFRTALEVTCENKNQT